MYTSVKVTVFADQYEKLKNAIAHHRSTTIKLNLDRGEQSNDKQHTMLLTHNQIQKIDRAKTIGKSHISIPLSKRQVQANVKHQGGFLGMLAGLAARALPTILTGLASGLLSGVVGKVVGGNGLYLHKSGHCVKIEPVKGGGLYLTPHHRGGTLPGIDGDGLYVKRGSSIHDGSGLIFGKNSPFKNIPILNLLL